MKEQLIERITTGVQKADAWAIRWGWLVLMVVAVGYYATYFQYGLNLGGEGGTTAVLAQRLMEGQRPIVDTFLGYNVLWFYPLVWLFCWTGPDYLVMRGYFFFLCLLAAFLGATVVWRLGRSGLLALGTGLILVLIPGMLFRNYMGLLGVMNQLVMLSAFLMPFRSGGWRVAWISLSGLVLGLTYLIRIEVGLLMTVIWIGLLVLHPLWREGFCSRLREAVLGGAGGVLLLGLVHLPVAVDAERRGYAKEFWGQYVGFKQYMGYLLEEQIQLLRSSASESPASQGTTSAYHDFVPVADAPPPPTIWRPRPPWQQMFTGIGERERYFAAAVYLPVLIILVWTAAGSILFLLAFVRRNEELRTDALTILVLTGCSLTLFPQYFFFRPDTPHIVEFMIPFLVAVIGVFALAGRRYLVHRSRPYAVATGVAAAAVIASVWMHFGHAWPKESAGTMAARWNSDTKFRGLNGVRVFVRPEQALGLEGLQRTILAHSDPEDWVVCLPYSPTINLMTARRSYLWNLYMDDSNRHGDFQLWQISQIEENRPAVIVVDHRAINQTEESRFANWAPKIYQYIRDHYELMGEFLGNEVFVRPDKVSPGWKKPRGEAEIPTARRTGKPTEAHPG